MLASSAEILATTGFRTSDRPAHSQLLYRDLVARLLPNSEINLQLITKLEISSNVKTERGASDRLRDELQHHASLRCIFRVL